MDVSIVIVNFNTFELVKNCVTTINQYTVGLSYEIIVIDNSTSKFEEEKFRQQLPNIIYVKTNSNIGFGRANNLGFSKAQGRYILALNSDTLFWQNTIKECLNFIQSSFAVDHNIGMIGCKLLNEDLTFQHSFFPFTDNSLWTFFKCSNPILYKIFRIGLKYKEPDQIHFEVGDISGAFMFFDKKIFEITKGFDPNFFLYCEETEWCRERIRKIFNIYYLSSTSIIHLGGKSAPKRLMFIQNVLSCSLLWYKKGFFPYFFYIIISYLNVFTYAITYSISGKQQKNISKKYIDAYIKIFFYHFYHIPKFVNKNIPIIYLPLKKLFFENS